MPTANKIVPVPASKHWTAKRSTEVEQGDLLEWRLRTHNLSWPATSAGDAEQGTIVAHQESGFVAVLRLDQRTVEQIR